jgi:hypothetical protein
LASSIQLTRTINLASLGIGQRPLTGVGGFANEPAFSFGDWVRNFILSPPFSWRWNRNVVEFVTTVGVKDYGFAETWEAGMTYAQYTLVTDSNGFLQQATVGGTSGVTTPTWSTTAFGTTTDGTVTWQKLGEETGLGVELPDFGWLERASVNDGTTTYDLEVSLNVGATQSQERPTHISPRLDDGEGSVVFRLFPAPDKVYKVGVTYQKACPNFQNLTDTWYPIPDYFSYMYNTGFLAKCYEYVGDEKFGNTMQLFLKQVVSASEGLKESQKNLFLDNAMRDLREVQSVQKGGQ